MFRIFETRERNLFQIFNEHILQKQNTSPKREMMCGKMYSGKNMILKYKPLTRNS